MLSAAKQLVDKEYSDSYTYGMKTAISLPDPLFYEAIGFRVARSGLALRLGELGEQAVYGLLIIAIHKICP